MTAVPAHEVRTPLPPPPPSTSPDPAVVDYVRRAGDLLWSPAGARHREWLEARGLGDGVLKLNQVGADPGPELMARIDGLPAGGPAVVFPSMSPGGAVTFAQVCYLDPATGRGGFDTPAKRLAVSPRVGWMRPSAPCRAGVLVVCEDAQNALVAAQAGFSAVGLVDWAYPDSRVGDPIASACTNMAQLHDVQMGVVVCFRADEAGRVAASSLIELLEYRRVRVIDQRPPAGMDLTSWALHAGDWHEVLAKSAEAAREFSFLADVIGDDLVVGGVAYDGRVWEPDGEGDIQLQPGWREDRGGHVRLRRGWELTRYGPVRIGTGGGLEPPAIAERGLPARDGPAVGEQQSFSGVSALSAAPPAVDPSVRAILDRWACPPSLPDSAPSPGLEL